MPYATLQFRPVTLPKHVEGSTGFANAGGRGKGVDIYGHIRPLKAEQERHERSDASSETMAYYLNLIPLVVKPLENHTYASTSLHLDYFFIWALFALLCVALLALAFTSSTEEIAKSEAAQTGSSLKMLVGSGTG